ncbi:allene oxide cyclase barrel-like domain-containing protein [Streptomyces collinus]|uniref:allene oxide cyclase barrel-like domain-containing protein n=1 Tax=Streptomyces collinus TaxID=42684 RepID=UPI003438BE6C
MRKIRLRQLLPVTAAALVLAGTQLASASTGSAPGAHQRAEIVRLVAAQTQSQTVDTGQKGHSLGDQLVIAEDLYQNGKKVGDHAVVCTYVHTGPDTLQCLGTFALSQGQITGQALLHLPSRSAVDVAITGGSGTYNGAEGYVHTVPAGSTERHLTFHITR